MKIGYKKNPHNTDHPHPYTTTTSAPAAEAMREVNLTHTGMCMRKGPYRHIIYVILPLFILCLRHSEPETHHLFLPHGYNLEASDSLT